MNNLKTRKQTAKALGISSATLSRIMASGAIEFFKIRGRTLFSDDQIFAYLHSVRRPTRAIANA